MGSQDNRRGILQNFRALNLSSNLRKAALLGGFFLLGIDIFLRALMGWLNG